MKKLWISLLVLLMCFPVLLHPSDHVSAAGSENVIDRVNVVVDYPVDGVSLKSTAQVYEFIDSKNMEMIEANTASEVLDVYWYKTTDPAKVLAKGYKAKLGESYIVSVVLKSKDGYSYVNNLHTKNNFLNNKKADVFTGTSADGTNVWLFESTLHTIAAPTGNPHVAITDMNLTPYEGNPMEIKITAYNATNVKYQWQITYGDSDGWGGTVDLDDNQAYRGTKTDHFKIHSYFGDNFDEELNFAKIQCKITSDFGTVYSKQVWYTLRDREVVNGFSLSGLDTPVFGKKPDYALSSSDSSKYNVKYVLWYGPEDSKGNYSEMKTGSTFKVGEYICKVIVAPTDKYKIDDTYPGKVDGKEYAITTNKGVNQVPYGPDTYTIEIPFTVKEIPLTNIKSDVTVPKAGMLPTNAVSSVTGLTATKTEWHKMDSRGRYIALKAGEKFEADTTYRCSICMTLEEGYMFSSSPKAFVNGKEASFSMLKGTDYRWIEYKFKTDKENPDNPDNPDIPNKPDIPDVPDVPDNPFTDVNETSYYYKPVIWAVSEGITTGTSNTTFDPDAGCTRAQAVTFIWRAAGKPEPTSSTMPFDDVVKGSYYEKAVLWAVEKGITTGTTKTTFAPDETCTRSQIVTFLWRSNGQPQVSVDNPFADVIKERYYYNAVLWAVSKGITTGTSKTEFSPDNTCTRAQIVTFLYRN